MIGIICSNFIKGDGDDDVKAEEVNNKRQYGRVFVCIACDDLYDDIYRISHTSKYRTEFPEGRCNDPEQ